MTMNDDRWGYTTRYLNEVFGREPAELARIRANAERAGLPAIAISADVGRMLSLLASTTRKRLAIEIGALGGYSGAWIARGLGPSGKLVSFELSERHAEVARASLAETGFNNVELRVGDARELLTKEPLAPASVDLVFIDADKESYVRYFELVRDAIAPGGLLIADNVLGAGSWWIDNHDSPTRAAVDRFNRVVCADDRFEVVAVPLREGVLVARRRD
ncbi:MAG: O-methyltransferase [Deltaproteobacteria bacterium]|nr:O-methyltransferase [Deltaproteobacteria bacterium]